MMVLIAYDVNTETKEGQRCLRHVAKLCENRGQRVQNSVFECLVDPAQWTKLRQKLIDTIDLSRPEGQRNRAIMEVLYGCGLRVSELVNLKISGIFWSSGFIKVSGKGNKERLVPLGSTAQKFIKIYLDEIRIHLAPFKESADILFLNKWGRKLSRVMIFLIIKELAEKCGIKKSISPHVLLRSE